MPVAHFLPGSIRIGRTSNLKVIADLDLAGVRKMKIDFRVHVTPPEIIKDYQKIGAREPYLSLSDSPKISLQLLKRLWPNYKNRCR